MLLSWRRSSASRLQPKLTNIRTTFHWYFANITNIFKLYFNPGKSSFVQISHKVQRQSLPTIMKYLFIALDGSAQLSSCVFQIKKNACFFDTVILFENPRAVIGDQYHRTCTKCLIFDFLPYMKKRCIFYKLCDAYCVSKICHHLFGTKPLSKTIMYSSCLSVIEGGINLYIWYLHT